MKKKEKEFNLHEALEALAMLYLYAKDNKSGRRIAKDLDAAKSMLTEALFELSRKLSTK